MPAAFDEDLHIENVGGTVSMIERAKNLKEEKSQSFSASADMYHRFGAFQVNFSVEGFYTRLSDVFVLENIGERDGILIKERRNGSGAKVLGLSMEGKMAYLFVPVTARVTLQQSRYDEPERVERNGTGREEDFPYNRIPMGTFTATYMPIKPLSLSLSGTYTGSMLVQHMAGYIDKDVAVNTRDSSYGSQGGL
ncbi:MAG: TonB-dependent receptor domain-containing protein [Parabacteroides distasonis]